MNIKNNKGFSLIEVLVTVGLIGVLVSIAVPSYKGYKQSTIKMAMRTDLGNAQKVYGAKYAIESNYCHEFIEVGLSTDKDESPIYINKGFFGFGAMDTGTNACGNIAVKDVQYISVGAGKCSVAAGSASKAICTNATNMGSWTLDATTTGQNAPACTLGTNSFKIGSYTDVSSLETFIQSDDQGLIVETPTVTDCQ